jgi:hypothetical protein
MHARLRAAVRSGAWLAAACLAAGVHAGPLPPRAEITLVGPAPGSAAVKEVTSELLAREKIDVSWAGRASFRPEDIFEAPAGKDATISVWIDLSSEGQARLYFRDCRSDRFFLRSLPISRGSGVDELAKEEIAHVVANAVSALGKGGGETLTRSEARTALQVPDPPAPARPAWHASAALVMGAQLFAHELALVAKPSALLAVAYRLPGLRASALGGWASLGYQLPADYRGSLVGAEVRSTGWRAGVFGRSELTHRLALGLGAGGGMELIRYSPQSRSERIAVAPAGSFDVLAFTCLASFEVRLVGGMALALQLSGDVLLDNVHFDLKTGDGPVAQVIRLYSFRPGAALGVAYAY